jgi:hypothetical protein
MINVVHQRGLQVDQWTGETIEGKRLRIPTKGGKIWTGCYGTPSTALSALAHHVEENHLTSDEAHELYDIFQASLRRNVGHEDTKFTSVPAPNYKCLQMWGGGLTLEDYHKQYDHDFQVRAITQEIMWGKQDEEDAGKTDTQKGQGGEDQRPSNLPKKWRLSDVTQGGTVKESKVDMPRCVTSFIEFLRANVTTPGIPGAVIVYLHPANPQVFGVGSPADWNDKVNRHATDALGHVPVFGNVRVYHKNKIRDNGKKRPRVEENSNPIKK